MKKKQEAPCVQEASSPLGGADVFVSGGVSTLLFISGWRCGAGVWEGLLVVMMWQSVWDKSGQCRKCDVLLAPGTPYVVKSRQWYERGARGSRKRYMQILSAPNVDGKPVRMMPVHLLGGKKAGSLQDMRRRFIRGAAVGLGDD